MSRMQDVLGELQRLGAVGKPAAPALPAQEAAAPPPEPPPDLGVETDTADAEEAIAALTEGFREEAPEDAEDYEPKPVETALESEDEPEIPADPEDAAADTQLSEALVDLKLCLSALESAISDANEQVSRIRRMLK